MTNGSCEADDRIPLKILGVLIGFAAEFHDVSQGDDGFIYTYTDVELLPRGLDLMPGAPEKTSCLTFNLEGGTWEVWDGPEIVMSGRMAFA